MLNKIIFALFVAPLCLRPYLPSSAYPKEDILLSICIVTASILLLLSNTLSKAGSKPQSPVYDLRQDKAILAPLSFYFAAILASTLFSKNLGASFSIFYKYATYLFVFIAVLWLPLKRQKTLVLLLLANAAIASIYALRWFIGGTFHAMDYLSHHGASWDFAFEFLSRGRAFLPFIFPNYLAGYLILFIPLATAMLFHKSKDINNQATGLSVKNICLLTAVCSTAMVLLNTQSIGAITSLLAAIIIYGLTQKKSNTASKLTTLAASFLASMLILVVLLRSNNQHEFNHPLFSLSQRLSYWKHAFTVAAEHPFTGVGPGNYPFFKSLWAHNAYLQTWVETGFFGLFGLIYTAATTLKINFKNITAGDDKRFIASLWVGNLAFLIHNTVETTFFQPEISLQWWIFAAVLCSAHTKYRQ